MTDSSEDSCEVVYDDPHCYRIVEKDCRDQSLESPLDTLKVKMPLQHSQAKEILRELRTLPLSADPARSEEYHLILHFKLKRIIAKQEHQEKL